MLNSRYDPATPIQWAEAAAKQSGARLLTYDGWGHAAYYMFTGELPTRRGCGGLLGGAGAGNPPDHHDGGLARPG